MHEDEEICPGSFMSIYQFRNIQGRTVLQNPPQGRQAARVRQAPNAPTEDTLSMACHARAHLCAVFVACCLAGSCAEQLGAPNPVPKVRRPVLRSAVQADSPATGSELSKPSLLLASASAATAPRPPAFQWAVLHNWLYFLSLGLSVPNLPRVISSIVNPDGSTGVSPASSMARGARTLD